MKYKFLISLLNDYVIVHTTKIWQIFPLYFLLLKKIELIFFVQDTRSIPFQVFLFQTSRFKMFLIFLALSFWLHN